MKIAAKSAISAVLIIASVVLFGCSEKDSTLPVENVPVDDLKNAPEQVVIDGTEITISSFLWRDFMPPTPEDGRELAAVVDFETIDQSNFPNNLIIDKLWVINKDEIWETTFSESGEIIKTYRIRKSAHGGPKWEIGAEVIVVVQIRDENQQYYIKESDVPIGQTF